MGFCAGREIESRRRTVTNRDGSGRPRGVSCLCRTSLLLMFSNACQARAEADSERQQRPAMLAQNPMLAIRCSSRQSNLSSL